MPSRALSRIPSGRKRWGLAASLVAIIVYKLVKRRRERPRGSNITFIPGHWLFGNLFEVIRAAMNRQMLQMGVRRHQIFGRTIALKIPLRPWTVKTTCPKNVEYILKTNFHNYPKGASFSARLFELLGGGIFNVDGQEWHRQRKTTSRMFTATLLKEHIWVVVRRNARKLRDILESRDPHKPVDVFNLMNRFTLDSIGEIGFGRCIGSLEDPSSPFLASFDKAQQISFWRFVNPFWRLFRLFGIGPEKERREHFGLLDAYSRSVVRELCSNMDHDAGKTNSVGWADIEARKSFLGLFLEDAKAQGKTLSEPYLRDLVLNFLIAGRDTTAQALSWTIFCLSQNPEAEAAARRQVIDVCGVRGPAWEDMSNLPYLDAVISEALRLYPSVPQDMKKALCDDVWPDGTFVASGSQVIYDIYSMGRDHSTWGEDAEQFRPERWLEKDFSVSNYQYPVFNAGPRECLGRRLAMVEMKTCLAMLLPQVSFKLAVPIEQVETATQLTIGMHRGLPCFVTKITAAERVGSTISTTFHSDGEAAPSETASSATAGVSSEAEKNAADTSENGSQQDSSDTSGSSSRRRGKKRLSGWTRQRRSKFWQRVRESTPERWPTGQLEQMIAGQ